MHGQFCTGIAQLGAPAPPAVVADGKAGGKAGAMLMLTGAEDMPGG